MKWKTEQRKIDDLIPHETNPRRLTDKQAADLKASLQRFDLAEIPAINTNNKILAGHQRLKTMQLLGRGQEVIDVRVPDRELTADEEREYLIRSNKNTGEWDMDVLQESFELDALTDWGFSEDELQAFESPDFDPGTEDEQGQLDEIDPDNVQCPKCGKVFDGRENKAKD